MPSHIYADIGKKQGGIIMVVTLISLVIMLLASIALIRSTDTNLLIAGHLSFKRDIVNQAQRVIPVIKKSFTEGALLNKASREANLSTANYFATILASNSSGIPNILTDISTFDATYAGQNITDSVSRVTIRYVVDRMCLKAGVATPTSCSLNIATTDKGGNPSLKVTGAEVPVYRISIRATGPRNTETYLQSIFAI